MIKILLLLSMFISCNKDEKKSVKTLNLALSSDVSTMDTALAYDTISSKVIGQINETLYQYNYLNRPYTLIPLLAESMPEIKNNGLEYIIKIKKNITYQRHKLLSKNRFLKAEDFINQFRRLAFKPTNSTGWWLFDKKILGLNEFRQKAKKDFSNFFDINIEGLVAKDDHTLIIKLTRPYPQLKYALAMVFTSPIPKEILKAQKNDFSRGVVGTGPYYLDEWINGSKIVLKKFKNYRKETYPDYGDQFSHANKLLEDSKKDLPLVDQINFNIIKEAQTAWLNFMKGNIDLIVLNKEQFPLALDAQGNLKKELKDKNIQLQIASTMTYWWLAFNMKDPILGQKTLVRQAIAHAVNMDEYIKIFTNNIALKANSIYPPGIDAYAPSNELPYKYDLKKAKMLLANAGYPNGKGLPVISYDVRGNSTVSRQMGEFIKKELSKIGIKVNVIQNPFNQFLRKARNGQLQFWQGGWALDYPDAENIIQLLYSGNHAPGPNNTFYSNPQIDKIYEELSKTESRAKAKELTKRAEKIINKELPWIMQFYSRNYILHYGRVKNFRQADLIYNDLKYLNIKK